MVAYGLGGQRPIVLEFQARALDHQKSSFVVEVSVLCTFFDFLMLGLWCRLLFFFQDADVCTSFRTFNAGALPMPPLRRDASASVRAASYVVRLAVHAA